MQWWIWIVFGAALLAAEVILATDFYLVFFGAAGLAVGLALLFGLDLPLFGQWLAFAALAIGGLVTYRRRLRAMLAKPDRELDEHLIDKVALARGEIAPGAMGSAELRGTVWQARNVGADAVADGAGCVVVRVDGVTIEVRAEAERPA